MAQVSLRIVGLDRVERKLNSIGKSLEPALEQAAEVIRKKLVAKRYAPKRPRQKYIRTGRLGRSWSRVEKIGRLAYRIRNTARNPKGNMPYAIFVIGDNQAFMHKGRWWTARRAGFEEPPKPIVTFAAEIRKVLNG